MLVRELRELFLHLDNNEAMQIGFKLGVVAISAHTTYGFLRACVVYVGDQVPFVKELKYKVTV